MRRNQTILAVITLGLLAYGFYQAIFAAPTEQTMGDIQRIFYYHVPSAWTAGVLFFANFAASVIYLTRRSPEMAIMAGRFGNILTLVAIIATLAWPGYPMSDKVICVVIYAVMYGMFWLLAHYTSQGRADAWAVAFAEVGVVFCTIVLITGPLWARPVWGIWWTWDVRLTTTLVCWMIYVSYLLLRKFSESTQTATLAAALAVFGFLDVPIVYMSIRWWRTQHPQPVFAGAPGSGIDPAMRFAVMMNWVAFLALAAFLTRFRFLLGRAEQRLQYQHTIQALDSDGMRMPTELKGIR